MMCLLFLMFDLSTVGPGEVSAVLCLDNKKVANTDWKPPSNAAWEQQFKVDLDKVCYLHLLIL